MEKVVKDCRTNFTNGKNKIVELVKSMTLKKLVIQPKPRKDSLDKTCSGHCNFEL